MSSTPESGDAVRKAIVVQSPLSTRSLAPSLLASKAWNAVGAYFSEFTDFKSVDKARSLQELLFDNSAVLKSILHSSNAPFDRVASGHFQAARSASRSRELGGVKLVAHPAGVLFDVSQVCHLRRPCTVSEPWRRPKRQYPGRVDKSATANHGRVLKRRQSCSDILNSDRTGARGHRMAWACRGSARLLERNGLDACIGR